ncbi:MAG: sulfite dehydrogenase [Pseudomonadales bacterium]|nr:sulfite dehydrogenase [Pseudomonadales bacterium]
MTDTLRHAAGNGLLHRRHFLRGGLAVTGGMVFARARASDRPEWMRMPGAPMSTYGSTAGAEGHVQRLLAGAQPGTTGSGASLTPLQHLEGTITPSGLHFERHHSGVPAIDPERHTLTIHGDVQRPLRFSMDDLLRYPRVTRQRFLECSGNTRPQYNDAPMPHTCAMLYGLLSGSEWTGVPVSILLEEAGVAKDAAWVVAEGADAARMSRSIPLDKMLDDAIIALYQNGERLRPENGYPVRLFLPGWEGNTSVKWLTRLQVSRQPAMSREETSKYTDPLPDGRARMFTFPMGVKSVITSPSPGLTLGGPGLYEISGLAWSGSGAIRRVDVSADGGRSWAEAALEAPVQDKALTRFRLGWQWDGAPCTLLSRASDAQGAQPTRDALLAIQGARHSYHYNAIQAWQVNADGELANVYA